MNSIEQLVWNNIMNLNDEVASAIIEQWEIDRGAEGFEDVYNIKDKDGYITIVKMYGIETAQRCYNSGRTYFLCGSNFNVPVGFLPQQTLKAVWGDVVDEIFEFPELYTKWINLGEIMRSMASKINKI